MPTDGLHRCDGHHRLVDCIETARGALASPARPALPLAGPYRRFGKVRLFEKDNTIGRHGRRKRNLTVTQLCRDASPEIVETLIKIMRDERAPLSTSSTTSA